MGKLSGKYYILTLWENVLPCLFFEKLKYIPTIVGTLITTTINEYIIGLQ